MTKEQLESMTKEQYAEFDRKSKEFDSSLSFEEYVIFVRDIVYIGGYLTKNKWRTWEYSNELVVKNLPVLESFYNDKDNPLLAAGDILYVCG